MGALAVAGLTGAAAPAASPAATTATGTISGIVAGPGGSPVQHAWVSSPLHSTYTGDDGRYSFTVAAGARTVSVFPSGSALAPVQGASARQVTVEAGATVRLDVALTAAAASGTVTGTVTDTRGRAAAGVLVGGTHTDAAGHHTWYYVPTGAIEVGQVPPETSGLLASSVHASVPAGGTSVVDAVLTVGASVGGRVTGPDGAPVAGLRVEVAGARDAFVATTTDADGRYVSPSIPGDDVVVTFVGDPGQDVATEYYPDRAMRAEAVQISWLADQWITTGYADGTFQPSMPVSREAVAAFLSRADEVLRPVR